MITSSENENKSVTVNESSAIEYQKALPEKQSVIANTSASVQIVKSVSTSRTSGEVKLRIATQEMATRTPSDSSR